MFTQALYLAVKIPENNYSIFTIPYQVQFVAVVKQNLPCFTYPDIYLLFLEKQISVHVHQQLGDTRSLQSTPESFQMVFGPAPLISRTEALICI